MGRSLLRCRNFGVRDTGQVPFRGKHCLLVRPVEIRAINGSTQVGQKHAAAFQIQSDPDSFHQMVGNNHRFLFAISSGWIHGRTVNGVATRRIAAVRPVNRSVGKIEFEVNRFRQALVEKFNVFAICGTEALRNFEIGAKDSSLAGIVRALLSPIKLSGFDVERDPYAPFLYVLPRPRVAFAGIDKGFDLGAIQVRSHNPHAFAIAPIKLPALLIELKLLGSERAARWNNLGSIATVKIRALNGAVIRGGYAHIGPIDVPGRDVHNDAIWKSVSLTHDGPEVRTVGVGGKYLATASTEKEQAGSRAVRRRLSGF